MSDEYRIEFTIERNTGDEDWAEIGFGSSGAWEHLDAALYAMQSDIQNRQWETESGMPAPDTIDPPG